MNKLYGFKDGENYCIEFVGNYGRSFIIYNTYDDYLQKLKDYVFSLHMSQLNFSTDLEVK